MTTLIISKQFKVGDIVRVQKSLSTVRELQKGHGGWNDDMEKVSGGRGNKIQDYSVFSYHMWHIAVCGKQCMDAIDLFYPSDYMHYIHSICSAWEKLEQLNICIQLVMS